MKQTAIIMLSILALLLAACGGSETTADIAPPVVQNGTSGSQTNELAPVVVVATDGAVDEPAPVITAQETQGDQTSTRPSSGDVAALAENYAGALSVRGQLTLGILQLEEIGQPVTAEQAETMLPLWQALNALVSSGTAAEAELEAVVNQIQKAMTPQQVAAIADMQLTEESMDDLATSGDFSRGQQGQGGPGGGGFAGGGLPGGGRPGGGALGGPGGGLDPDALATRQAEFAAGGTALFIDRLGGNMVVRLLQAKTGDVPAGQLGAFGAAMAAVAQATGLSDEALREETAASKTLADIVVENGGDLDAVRQAIVDALVELGTAEDQDLETLANDLLNSSFPSGGFGRGRDQQDP